MVKTAEHKFSITAKFGANNFKSHEDADKDYGDGTADQASKKETGEVMLTIRGDDLEMLSNSMQSYGDKMKAIAIKLLRTGKSAVEEFISPEGIKAEVKVSPRPPKTPIGERHPEAAQKPSEAAQQETPEEYEPWHDDPHKEMWRIIKAHEMGKKAYASFKNLEKSNGGAVNKIPKDKLLTWLKSYHKGELN